MIHSQGLSKSFRLYKKKAGLKGSILSFFHREFETKTALSPIDLDIKKGEIIGLLGPNGAGKTTLMKMMTGIIVPTSGKIEVLGYEPEKRSRNLRKKIALVMGQKSQLWWDLPAMDSFFLIQKYYEIPDVDFHKRLKNLSNLLEVSHLLEVHVRKLSLGERMKVELMACLLHEPEIIFLDEPTIGLDLIAQQNIRKFLLDYHREKKPTLILTSHYMADIEALADRVILLIEGKKRFDGPIADFENVLGHNKTLYFTFTEPVKNRSYFEPFLPKWEHNYKRVEISLAVEQLQTVAAEILQAYQVTDFGTEKTPIERVLSELMKNPMLAGGE